MAATYGGRLSREAASQGVELYGEVADEARAVPGSHPSIDLLLGLLAEGAEGRAPAVVVELAQ